MNHIYNHSKYYQSPRSLHNSPGQSSERSHSQNNSNNLYLTATSFNANNFIHNVSTMDMYNTSYSASMKVTDQRYQYRKAENEAQLLSNRIRHLTQEEQKTFKKIDEAQKKTFELLSYRERNIKTSQERRRRKEDYEYQIEQKHQQVQDFKDTTKISKQLIQESIQYKIQTEAQQLKQTKMVKTLTNTINFKNQKMKEYQQHYFNIRNIESIQVKYVNNFKQKLAKTMNIKQQEREFDIRKERIQELKEQRAKGNYSRKLYYEIMKRENKEMEVKKLEKSEMRMVENLKNTQQIQTKAMKEFEDIIIQARNTSPSQKLNIDSSTLYYYSPNSPSRYTQKSQNKTHYAHNIHNSVQMERSDKQDREKSNNSKIVTMSINSYTYNPNSEEQVPNSIIKLDGYRGNTSRRSTRPSSRQSSPVYVQNEQIQNNTNQ